MTAIAFATSEAFPRLDDDSRPLIDALATRGVDATPAVWSDPAIDWRAFDAIFVRSAWDYVHRLDEFLTWVAGVPTRLFNPPSVVAWNAHKSYLRDLADRGVLVVDTTWIPPGATAHVEWDEAIVKPAVAGSALGLERAARGDAITAGATELLVQPFLPAIQTEGELSLLFAGAELSHAVRKTPTVGDIRVQEEWGGTTVPTQPTDEAREIAQQVLDAVDEPLAYARVDLVRAPDESLRLIELEVIEPSLYLGADPRSPDRFASAFVSAVAA